MAEKVKDKVEEFQYIARNKKAFFNYEIVEKLEAGLVLQGSEVKSIRHADDAVITEFDLLGTHLGPLRGIPPTGKTFRCPMTAFFLFDGDRIVCDATLTFRPAMRTPAGEVTGPVAQHLFGFATHEVEDLLLDLVLDLVLDLHQEAAGGEGVLFERVLDGVAGLATAEQLEAGAAAEVVIAQREGAGPHGLGGDA